MDVRSDESLMQAYQEGDSRAFDELYRRHAGRVYGYLRKRLSTAEAADEVFQATFLKAHRSRAKYRAKYPVAQWLYVIAQTSLIDYVRADARRAAILDEAAANPWAGLSQSASVPSLTSVDGYGLDSLPADQRRVVEMRVFEEKDYREIAAQLGKSQVSIRQLYSRAVRKLRAWMSHPQGGHR